VHTLKQLVFLRGEGSRRKVEELGLRWMEDLENDLRDTEIEKCRNIIDMNGACVV
jgi:hypothetical protein